MQSGKWLELSRQCRQTLHLYVFQLLSKKYRHLRAGLRWSSIILLGTITALLASMKLLDTQQLAGCSYVSLEWIFKLKMIVLNY